MTAALHWMYTALHLGVSLWNHQLFEQRGKHPLMLGLLFNSIGLAYDNFILGIGSWVGIGDLLSTLTVPRYVFHALLTPTLLWTAQYIAHHHKIHWALSRNTYHIVGLIVLALIVVGVQEHLLDYQAYPVCQQDGLVRYTQSRIHPELICDGFSYPALTKIPSPPMAAIATILVLILLGAHLALVNGNVWLLVGSLLMCAASASAGSSPTLWLGNGGEVLLVTSMTMAMRQAKTAMD